MANYLLSGASKQRLGTNAKLNISESNEFWNDCVIEEYKYYYQKKFI